MFIKFKNFFNFLGFLIIYPFIKMGKAETVLGSMLIIRLDAIGDYVLFRNFIKILKESLKYKRYKITLCGNVAWKELAESLDKNIIDNFIWIDREKFYGNLFYKYKILRLIRERGFETAIETTYSREVLFGDEIIKAANAQEKIGSTGSPDKHAKWKRNLFSDKWYSKLISSDDTNLFEFYRNKDFFQKLLETEIDIKKPFIDTAKISFGNIPDKDYVVLFPGGSATGRRWDIDNFLETARYILHKTDLKIVIDGSRKEINLAQYIWDNLKSERVFITAGTTSLSDMAKLLSGAKLLISNETSAVHFAVAVGTRFICISNGAYYKRFHPYPKEIFDGSYYIYPSELMGNNFDAGEYRFNSKLDINTIKPEEVKKIIDKLVF